MDLSQYRELFVTEAYNHIQVFNELIVSIEHDGSNRSTVDELFRHAHSLKGMAATMEFGAIAELAHAIEDVLGAIRAGEVSMCANLVDALLEGSDKLNQLVAEVEQNKKEFTDNIEYIQSLKKNAKAVAENENYDALPPIAKAEPSKSYPEKNHQFRQTDSFKTVRIKTEVLDRLVAITGELITTHHILEDYEIHNPNPNPNIPIKQPLRQLASLVRELRDEVFRARMLPFAFVAERFPRLIRDLARKQNKEVEFHIDGSECDLDRGVLEAIAEPLVHILRNAVDHGLEPPDERVLHGKPYGGNITLKVQREKDSVVIIVQDDGRGIDQKALIEKAVENRIITDDDANKMTTQEVLMLVCAPGISTSDNITDVSGRGVGMDAVKNAVHSLGGTLAISSEPGKGCIFSLQIPLTVSIIHALIVRAGNVKVAFPVAAVERTMELARKDIFEKNGVIYCRFEDESIPLKNLNGILGQGLPKRTGSIVSALLVNSAGLRVALLTDEIYGQQEIFVKPLATPLCAMKCFNGGTIVGDGSIIFVVDISFFTGF